MKNYRCSTDDEFIKAFNLENDKYFTLSYCIFCDVSENVMRDCISEYSLYKNKSGKIYELSNKKRLSFLTFVKLYFGDDGKFNRKGCLPILPDIFKCSNNIVANILFNFLMPLNKYNNHSVKLKDNYVFIDLD